MKLEFVNTTQDKLDGLIDAALARGKTIRRIILDRAERHALYSTGLVEKSSAIFYSEPRGTYRGIEIFAEEEVE